MLIVKRHDSYMYHEISMFERKWDDELECFVDIGYADGVFRFKRSANRWLDKKVRHHAEKSGHLVIQMV